MPTSTAQTPTNSIAFHKPTVSKRRFISGCKGGFSLLEIIIVVGVLSLLTGVAMINFMGSFGKSSFKREAMEIISTLKTVQNAAAQSNRRFAVMFDFIEQTYTMKEIRNIEDLVGLQDIDNSDAGVTLTTTQLSERCRIEFITFDDNWDTRNNGEIEDQVDARAYFIAGRPGWQNGGKIGLTDMDGNEYLIIVNRMSKSISLILAEDDTYDLEPKENLAF